MLQAQKVKPLELAFTALARMAAAGGEGAAALEATHRGLQAGVPPRLRAFTPALLAYAVKGQVQQALQVLIVQQSSQGIHTCPCWPMLLGSKYSKRFTC